MNDNIGTWYKESFTFNNMDGDALSFISAAGLTDSIQKSAINTLVLDLKSANIWIKIKAIYPFVGGTALSHKWNLKDPRDLDEAFRLVETGINTHNSNGVTMNGINGYFNTMINPLTQMETSDGNISIYQRDNRLPRLAYDIGISMFGVITKYIDGQAYFMWNGSFNNISMTDTMGLFCVNRNGTNTEGYKNGIKIKSVIESVNTLPQGLYIGSTGTGAYSNSNYAFVSIGDMLSESESLIFYNIIQKYQTTLGRNV